MTKPDKALPTIKQTYEELGDTWGVPIAQVASPEPRVLLAYS